MEILNLVLDFVLIIASVWMITVVKYFGGLFGKAFNLITWGAIILGMAHLLETITFQFFPQIETDQAEFLHRIIVLIGFVVVTVGFQGLANVNKTPKKPL
jgi:hypothetical protein